MGAEPAPRDLAQQTVVLTRMAQSGQIDAAQFNGGLLKLAWGFAVSKRIDQALHMVANLAPLYVRDLLVDQAAEDEGLTAAIEGLAEVLVAAGHVDARVISPPAFLPTQEIGRA